MISFPDIHESMALDEFASHAHLTAAVDQLRSDARQLVPKLAGRKVWLCNSTAVGGGVAEMLPKFITVMRELGVDMTWFVINADRMEFFGLTKHVHNLLHGSGIPELGDAERALYEDINRRNADAIAPQLGRDDILVIHDPQPAGLGAMIKQELGLPTIWRCHIGTEEHVQATRGAWNFLRPYVSTYDRAVFTAPEYVPSYLADRTKIITPAIDPLGPKNRELAATELMAVLCNAGLATPHAPVPSLPYADRALRVAPDGSFEPATEPEEIGLGYRPVVTQVSRWDRLKGFTPLMRGFAQLKTADRSSLSDDARLRLDLARLVLAGPDPASIQDDPEGLEVLEEMKATYASFDPDVQRDIAFVLLPMASRDHNALMVNAIQRCSTIVVQNSLREGFGLTATEAMWKGVPVMGTRAVGLRTQIADGAQGRLVADPGDADEIAAVLGQMLADPDGCRTMGRDARRRVYDQFLLFEQVSSWLRLLAEVAT